MNAPAYHLRPNKAVDRYILAEAIGRLARLDQLSNFIYYGLGGPYMEDFRTLYEQCEDLQMVSIEKDKNTYRRQQFHAPFRTAHLLNQDIFEFIDDYESNGQKSIFWLDFTDLKYRNFEYFDLLMNKVGLGSMLKITLRAEANDFRSCYQCKNSNCECLDHAKGPERFKSRFRRLMPIRTADPPRQVDGFGKLLQDMLRKTVEDALAGERDAKFQLINSLLYRDSTWMLTATGIVCSRQQHQAVRDAFDDWEFANLDWNEPRMMEIPALSTKERLHLQDKLPCPDDAGKLLHEELGYFVARNENESIRQLQDYADFHRLYPYFMRGVP